MPLSELLPINIHSQNSVQIYKGITFHKITELQGLEETSGDHVVQPS